MYSAYFYKTRRGKYPVRDFIQEQNKKSRAKIWRYVELLEKYGPGLLRPYADYLRDKVRELRMEVIEGKIRFLYFFVGKHAILLHAVKKKSRGLPKKEIEIAEARMNDFMIRYRQGEFKL